MKNLKQYIKEKLIVFHPQIDEKLVIFHPQVNEKLVIFHPQVDEKLVINKNYNIYKYYPKTPDELRKIIKDKYTELGPGTKNRPINFNDVDISDLTSFATNDKLNLFEATRFEYIDVSGWDISKIDNLNSAFAYCTYLKELDISNWDISNVQKSQYMFYRCGDLEKLLLPDFSKIKNINMIDMFDKCNPKSIPNWYITWNNNQQK